MKSQIKHLGVIMDGNRRWAKKNNLAAWLGHEHGIKPLELLVKFCQEYDIKHLTIYALSLENLHRPKIEVEYLLNLFLKNIQTLLTKCNENNIKINFLGDYSSLSENIINEIHEAIEKTKNNSGLILDILFCYGGQQEIIAAVKDICSDISDNKININNITKDLFESYLWSGNRPGPCLIIRTGNALRLSNFLLYKAAYSELYFLNKLWPELDYNDLIEANNEYENRTKNFGK